MAKRDSSYRYERRYIEFREKHHNIHSRYHIALFGAPVRMGPLKQLSWGLKREKESGLTTTTCELGHAYAFIEAAQTRFKKIRGIRINGYLLPYTSLEEIKMYLLLMGK